VHRTSFIPVLYNFSWSWWLQRHNFSCIMKPTSLGVLGLLAVFRDTNTLVTASNADLIQNGGSYLKHTVADGDYHAISIRARSLLRRGITLKVETPQAITTPSKDIGMTSYNNIHLSELTRASIRPHPPPNHPTRNLTQPPLYRPPRLHRSNHQQCPHQKHP
jgi:hypothetical protein